MTYRFFNLIFLCICGVTLAADPPKGFEDPALLAKVLNGQLVIEEKTSTAIEFRSVAKAFFKKVSTDSYVDLAINHMKYPDLFEEIKAGETLEISADKKTYRYRLDLFVEQGFLSLHLYPEGIQKIFRAPDTHSEARVENTITNYKEQINFANQVTRLIPYENGILVEDDVHFRLQKETPSSKIIKLKLREFFTKYVSRMRQALQGT